MDIVVTGATGVQGGHVARVLLAKGHRVRAVTRNASSDAARKLAAMGAVLVEGTWEDSAAMRKAVRGADALLLHTVPWFVGAPQEHTLAESIARAALDEKVAHTVFLSAAGADHGSGFVVLESKWRIENLLCEMKLPHTVVAPAFLMDNFLAPLWFGGIADGRFPIPLAADRALQMVSAENQAQLVEHIFRHRDAFLGRRLTIASDAPTCGMVAQTLSRSSGRSVQHELFPIEQVEAMNPSLPFLFRWMNARGHEVDVEKCRRELTMVAWDTFDAWCAKQDWSVLDAPPPPPAHDHDHGHG